MLIPVPDESSDFQVLGNEEVTMILEMRDGMIGISIGGSPDSGETVGEVSEATLERIEFKAG